jgi:formate hydrogenlyase transcriptional activator
MIRIMSAEAQGATRKGEPLDLRTVIDTIPALVLCALPDGSIEFVNQAWRKYTGFSSEELTGWGWQTAIHPDDVSKFVEEWTVARTAGKSFENEARVRRADGQYRWFLFRAVPVRDEQGNIVRWYAAGTDIEDRKHAERGLQYEKDRLGLLLELTNKLVSKLELRDLLGSIAASVRRVMRCDLVAVFLPDAEPGTLRPFVVDFPEGKGFIRDELHDPSGRHPIPMEGTLAGLVLRTRKSWRGNAYDLLQLGLDHNPGLAEGLKTVCVLPLICCNRVLGVLALARRDENVFSQHDADFLGQVASQVAIAVDNALVIEDRKRAEDALRQSEAYLGEAQTLSHTGSFGWSVMSGELLWSEETYNIFQHDPAVKPTLALALQRIHPDDRDRVQEALDRATNEKTDFDIEHRLLMADGSVKHVHVLARALETSSGNLEYVGAVTNITAAKQAEQTLRESEAYLAEAQRLSHTGSWAWAPGTGELRYWSEECFRILGFDPHGGQPRFEAFFQRIHPDDQAKVRETAETAGREKVEFELDYRIVHPGGEIRDIHVLGHPVLSPSRDLVEFVGTVIDVTERRRAEEKIRQSEMELRQIMDLGPQQVGVLGPDRSRLYVNQSALDYHGLTLEEWRSCPPDRLVHPDDLERVENETQSKFLSGSPFEVELRLRRNDGQYRWFLFRCNPLRDEHGSPRRWYIAVTDIEDRKQAEQRLQNENVALREEIDRASMFEEIVGISPALHAVLSRVSKVAPTDSTVLITGETGTGKELIARAVHKRSQRSSRAFVSVNCAAIPHDLIASELFGHEKGAFTGATQRRLGRFELAEGGTIFLDEIGELPAETQIALLRVLQEHEFERVGGAGSIRANLRVIAATNRDLEAAIAAGMFRSDLFYRLNVFPIEVPPLRERREDIPLLVGYFVDRYARKAGKSFKAVNKKSLDLLQSYPWPGNIRELQNVIERSVIVCETENFSVDESWLSRQPRATGPKSQLELSQKLASQEKEMIEAVLSESGGRVFGPSGAAAKLGMPRSTLESKIRSLKINKKRFKTPDRSNSN